MSLTWQPTQQQPATSSGLSTGGAETDAQDALGNAFLVGGLQAPQPTSEGGGWLDTLGDVAGWALAGVGLGGGDEDQIEDAGVPAGVSGAIEGAAQDGADPAAMVEGAQEAGPGNAPTQEQPVSEFADTATAMFDQVAGEDGRISAEDIDRAMSDPNLTPQQAAVIATLKNMREDIQGASDDDLLWESDISLADLQAFQSTDTLPQELQDRINGQYGYRRSRVEGASTELFATNPDGSVQAPDPSALRQGAVGDCWFLSAMGSVAAQNPQAIQDMIVPNEDGTYTVTFPNGQSATVAAPTPAELAYGANSGQNGMWATLMEKAYATVENEQAWSPSTHPIDQIDGARTPDAGTNVFSADGTSDSDFLALTSADTTAAKLEEAFANGRSVNALVGNVPFSDTGSDGLPDGHIYAVQAYDPATRTVTLRNPWGNSERKNADGTPMDGTDDGTFTVTVEEFNRIFTTASYASQGPTAPAAEATPVPVPAPTPMPSRTATPTPPAPTGTATPTATETPQGAVEAGAAQDEGEEGEQLVEAAQEAGPGNAPTEELPKDDFATTAAGMFDQLAGEDGVITPDELDKAMSNPDLTPNQAAALATMKNLKDDLKGVSNDEWFGETHISRADIEAFQDSGKLPQELLDKVNGDYGWRQSKIAGANMDLFAKNADGSTKLPDFNAVQQGSIGDCYFLSAMAAYASQNPQGISDMIVPNEDGTYTVTFPNGKSASVPAPTKQEIALYATSGGDGMWASLLEKAYGKVKNDEAWFKSTHPTDEADGGDQLSAGVNMFSDKNSSDTDLLSFTSEKTTGSKLESALSSGKVVTAGTANRIFGEDKDGELPSGHAYSVVGYDAATGMVTLRNPWGAGGTYGGVFTMTLEEFDSKFSNVSYGQ